MVAAVKAADYVDVLVNAGPFTVFAPTNAAFDQLPAGTLNDLLKPENKLTLQDILEYHVYVGVINSDAMKDGQRLNQVNLKNVQISVKEDGSIMVNDAKILASVPASNGVVHVIDKVLLAE
ncbi:MAG: fasciclin domain-containing protein [Saprospiraceae bacterium]